jgi:hypothetical protein
MQRCKQRPKDARRRLAEPGFLFASHFGVIVLF